MITNITTQDDKFLISFDMTGETRGIGHGYVFSFEGMDYRVMRAESIYNGKLHYLVEAYPDI